MVYDREKNYGSGFKKREYNFPLERIEPFFLKLFFSKKGFKLNWSVFPISAFLDSILHLLAEFTTMEELFVISQVKPPPTRVAHTFSFQ